METLPIVDLVSSLSAAAVGSSTSEGVIFVPLLSCTRLPPPDMSTLVKSWPYRELYRLIRLPCDGTGPDMSL